MDGPATSFFFLPSPPVGHNANTAPNKKETETDTRSKLDLRWLWQEEKTTRLLSCARNACNKSIIEYFKIAGMSAHASSSILHKRSGCTCGND